MRKLLIYLTNGRGPLPFESLYEYLNLCFHNGPSGICIYIVLSR